MPLDSRPARTDLTDRECSKIIGGVLGGLSNMATIETLRAAIRWWADTDLAWEGLRIAKQAGREAENACREAFSNIKTQ